MTSAGGIKLLDFGVAKYRASQARSQQGMIKGKPAYLAPETLENGAVDHRIDLFSLGVVLHELLTLEHLFEGDSHSITFHRVLRMPIPLPSRTRSDIPPALDAIVMKALERDPARRYQTAHEMAIDLDQMLAAEAARTDDAIVFARDLATLIPKRASAHVADRTRRSATAGTQRYLTHRFRASRVGRFLFGPLRDS